MRLPSLSPLSRRLLWLIAAVLVTILGVNIGRTWMTQHLTSAGRGNAEASGNAAYDASNAPVVPSTFFHTAFAALDARPATLGAFEGQLLIVNFWASWCGPCVREMPALTSLAQKYAPIGVKFVGIAVDNPSNVATFLERIPVRYPIYVAGTDGIDQARALGDTAGGLPYTILIDTAGRVRWTKLGEIDPDRLSQAIARVRAEAH